MTSSSTAPTSVAAPLLEDPVPVPTLPAVLPAGASLVLPEWVQAVSDAPAVAPVATAATSAVIHRRGTGSTILATGPAPQPPCDPCPAPLGSGHAGGCGAGWRESDVATPS